MSVNVTGAPRRTVGRKETPLLRKGAKPEDIVTINFIDDGLTAFARMWYRGQTVSIERGSEQWESTVFVVDRGLPLRGAEQWESPVYDEDGSSWMELDEDGQIDRWGKRFFRPGKWEGAGFDLEDPALTEEDKAILSKVESEEQAVEKPAAKRGPGRPRKPMPGPPSLKGKSTGSITP